MTLDNFLTFENIVSILIITLLMINMCMSIVIDDKVYGTLSLLYLLSIFFNFCHIYIIDLLLLLSIF